MNIGPAARSGQTGVSSGRSACFTAWVVCFDGTCEDRGRPGGHHCASGRRHRERRQHDAARRGRRDRKSTRLNSSHLVISYAVFCLKKKKNKKQQITHALLRLQVTD